jgi:hypothetical protein
MGIKRIAYPNTGIYQRKVSQVELRTDQESFNDLEELVSSYSEPSDYFVERIESEATDFLNTYVETEMGGSAEAIRRETESAGIDYVAQNYIDRVRDEIASEYATNLSQERKRNLTRRLAMLERADDACQILFLITGIRWKLQNSSPKHPSVAAVLEGFSLGRAYERFNMRSAERKAFTGGKALSGASAGGMAAKQTAKRRHEEIVAKFRRSGLSQRKFSEKYLVPLSNLKRAIKGVGSNPAK